MTKILISNNTSGNHPPEKWAMATAEEIFDTRSIADGSRTISAQKFQLDIAQILEVYHTKLQDNEKSRLSDDVEYIHTKHDASEYLGNVVGDIVKLSMGTQWEAHFANPEVQNAVKQVVHSHMVSSQHVERLFHADKNPDCEVSQAYKAKYNA